MSNELNSEIEKVQPIVYQIRIKGHLGRQWTDWFGGLAITALDNGETLLTGPLVDQAALYGVLRKVRDVGMPLLSVNRVTPGQAEASDVHETHHYRSTTNQRPGSWSRRGGSGVEEGGGACAAHGQCIGLAPDLWQNPSLSFKKGEEKMKTTNKNTEMNVTQVSARAVIRKKEDTHMKAIVYHTYGSPNVLKLEEVDKPTPKDDEVLVRVHAAGLHVGDCFAVRGAPFAMRLVTGLLKPKHGIPGFDVAGQVEAVGTNVKQFRPGDEVFGACNGACAEYVCVRIDKLALKPANLTFEEAAAVPTSALAALHALRDVGKVQPGQKVLINGASGGVGTFAVQIAKSFGAEVTGVCSTTNVDMVRSIGADDVIDYTQQDFTQGTKRYDLIFDNVENRSLSDCRRALTPSGTLILNSGAGAHGIAMLVRLVKPLVLSPFVRQKLRRYLSVPNHKDLVILSELVESGKLTPVIDRKYPLHETPAALGYIEGGHVRGKVVITVEQ